MTSSADKDGRQSIAGSTDLRTGGSVPLQNRRRKEPAKYLTTSNVVSTLITLAILIVVAWNLNWALVRDFDLSFLWTYRVAFVKGLGLTFLISFVAIAVGSVSGIILAILIIGIKNPLRWIFIVYVEIFRSLPLVVQLFWIHFALPLVTGISTNALTSGIIAISVQASAYLTDVARSGIRAVPRGQWEASAALGVSSWSQWTRIVLPQALRIMVPPLANITISFFKASAILSVLAVGELMSISTRVADVAFRPIETLTFAGFLYFIIGTLFASWTRRFEDRKAR